jgi:hypothetical protein
LTPKDRREALGAGVLVLLGVGLRLAFVARFPTEPVSDFRGLVLFGLRLRDEGLAVRGWHWVQFNPGLPLILSVLFRVFPHGVMTTARQATAVVTGLLPLMPFLLWRGLLGFRWRLAIGALLALWPGQVIFSGVVAQENWTLLPVVALACLAVRRLRDPAGGSFPVAAGLLYAAAGAIRQDMLAAMLLPAAAAAGLPGLRAGRGARSMRLAAAALVPLLALAMERRAATGRFAVTTEHGGLGVLGTLVPGSAQTGWVDPVLSIAAVQPDLLTDPVALRRATWRLAWDEARRRWRFHAFRVAASALRLSVESEAGDLLWGLEAPRAQPPETAPAAAAFAGAARPLLRIEQALISGLFAVSLLLALRRRDSAMLVLGAAAVVEMVVQALFSPLGRLMVPVIALELLVVSLAAAGIPPGRDGVRSERTRLVLLGVAVAAILFVAAPALHAVAVRKDEAPPRIGRFPMFVAGGGGVFAECSVEAGRLWVIAGDRARVGADTGGTGGSRVVCRLPLLPQQAALSVDLEASGPGSIRIAADDRAVPSPPSASAATESSWHRVPVTAAGEPAPREIVVESDGGTFGFGLVGHLPGARPLPRDLPFP